MLKIAICDDNQEESKLLKSAVERIIFSQTEYKIVIYSNGKQLIQDIEADSFQYDLLFLDIHMPGKDGLSVAQLIRKKELDLDIIFFTISKNHIFEGYTYKAFSYLLKPLDENMLKKELGRYLLEKNTVSSCLNVNIQGNKVRIPLKKVRYFYSQGRKVQAVMTDEIVSFYEKMGDVYQMVEKEGFIRCHQSYIVNRRFINSYNQTSILLDQDERITISRGYQKVIKEQLEGGREPLKEEQAVSANVTKSLAMNLEEAGSLVFVKGEYIGTKIRIEENDPLLIGRDPAVCNLVFTAGDISRKHCNIRYCMDTGNYHITDYSKLGCFIDGQRLEKEKEYEVLPESRLVLGKGNQEIIFGGK